MKIMNDNELDTYDFNIKESLSEFHVFLLWEMKSKDKLILKWSNYIYYNENYNLLRLIAEIEILVRKKIIKNVVVKLHNDRYWHSSVSLDFQFSYDDFFENYKDYLDKQREFSNYIYRSWWTLEFTYKCDPSDIENELNLHIENWKNNHFQDFENNYNSIKQLEIVSKILKKNFSQYWDNTSLYVDFLKIPEEIFIITALLYLNQLGLIELENIINENHHQYGDHIDVLPSKFRLKIKNIKKIREYSNIKETIEDLNDKIWFQHPFLEKVENMTLYIRDSHQKLQLTKIQEKIVQKFLKSKDIEVYLRYENFCDTQGAFKKMLTRFNTRLLLYWIKIKKINCIDRYKIEKNK